VAKIFCSLAGKYFHDVINEINFNNCSYSVLGSVGNMRREVYFALQPAGFLFRPLILFYFGHDSRTFGDDHENCLIGRMNMNVPIAIPQNPAPDNKQKS